MKRKLQIYPAMLLALMLCGARAIAQITSYTIDQTVTFATGALTVDVDGDGVDDYTFEILPLSGEMNAARVLSLGNARVMDSSTFGYPDALDFGDEVTEPYSGGNAVLGTDVGGGGQFSGLGPKYLGLKLERFGESHLAWLSLELAASNDTIYLLEAGWNEVANDAITAGQLIPTSVSEFGANEVEIYPNPCRNQLTLDGLPRDQALRFAITDLSGQLLLSGSTTNTVDVSQLSSGAYLLTIFEGQKVWRQRFVKL